MKNLAVLVFATVLNLAVFAMAQVVDVWPVVHYRTPVMIDYGSSVYDEDLPF